MVSCWNKPPKTFLTSFWDSDLGFGLATSFGFGAGDLSVGFLIDAFWAGRDRALACPLTVATCTLGSSAGFWTADFSCELRFSQDIPELMPFALARRSSSEAPAAAAFSSASSARLEATASCFSSLFTSSSSFFAACAASRALPDASRASSSAFAFARASA